MQPLFAAVFLAPLMLVVIVAALWRNPRELKKGLLLWVFIESCSGYLAYKDQHYWDGIDEHPVVAASDIVGTWRCGDESVSFADDGSFVTSKGVRGAWSVSRGGLSVEDPSETVWWTMKESGQLFLLPEPRLSDPDEWNKYARFLKSGTPSPPPVR